MASTGMVELQLDGLPGPTHHFGGLSPGNLASQRHAGWRSRPRAAARQGLAKMRTLLRLGAAQALLPPLARPDLGLLRACGLVGSDEAVLAAAATEAPHLLNLAASSAFMWSANCATVIPGADSADRRCHVVVANLAAMPHRSGEGPPRAAMLRRLFRDAPGVVVHDPLPLVAALGDEGAANHTRLSGEDGIGHHLLVYGRAADLPAADGPQRHPARQSREASAAVARIGRLPQARAVYARQHPASIDAGAFHNDVVMVGDRDRLLLHQHALVDQHAVLDELRQRIPSLRVAEVRDDDLSLAEAVSSYLFNSQLLSLPAGRVLVAPAQAAEGRAGAAVRRLLDDGFIDAVEFIDLGESMANGGGPACLRLRVPLASVELAGLAPGVRIDEERLRLLEGWVDRHYREQLAVADLADASLLSEGRAALDELAGLLGIDQLYPPRG